MNKTPTELLQSAITAATDTLQRLGRLEPSITSAADLITTCLHNGNKVLVCGNGGSAADAADFTTEFTCRFDEDRQPYPALNLADGGSLLTAAANDYGFEEIFARQVRAFGKPGDILVGITTSGKSNNVRRALLEAKSQQLKTISLLGRDGGECAGVADVELLVPGTSTARIQEAHKFLLHVLCELCETALRNPGGPEKAVSSTSR
jgi:D-sedoheptulose 7-phosphate isomerase